MTADQKLVKQSWQKAYKAALDADIWGQADDAHDNYYKSVLAQHRCTAGTFQPALVPLTHSPRLAALPNTHCRLSENIEELTSHIGLSSEEKVS